MRRVAWCIITGEYPPQHGGVSDYTRLVASELAKAGDEVHVWAPRCEGKDPQDAGVTVHRLADQFGRRSLKVLGEGLDRIADRRLLVQYLPHAYGRRSMNVPFCLWLYRRGSRDVVWVLFHEVAHAIRLRQSFRHNGLGIVHRLMATLVARASDRIFVTIPAWRLLLQPLVEPGRVIEWLPVPATLPAEVPSERVAAVRDGVLGKTQRPDQSLIGHFGTYGSFVSEMLKEMLPPLIAQEGRYALLMGRGSKEFAASLISRHSNMKGRLFATGGLDPDNAAVHLAACDIVVQPYPDGISCRRTSAMASLALGVPVVTVSGHLTESLWLESNAVALAPEPTADSLCAEANRVLAHAESRRDLALVGKSLYKDRFDPKHIVASLRSRGGDE
jgi:glycosyltransferase involved in cell wall biosynthesis